MCLATINKTRRLSPVRRHGISSIELVVAATILMTVMTFATTLSFRIHSVIKDTRHVRIATNELANQLERLTLLDLDNATAAVESLEVSEICQTALNEPKLSGTIVKDPLGHRVDLQLVWQTRITRKPIRLSGWIVENRERTEDDE